jgi:LmbE family N-acetylglucosaminyl deacetylase
MLSPQLFPQTDHVNETKHILCLGAHCDDIEIGCGGTLLQLLEHNTNIEITWVVFTSSDERKIEAEVGVKLFTQGVKKLTLKVFNFRDGFLPYSGIELKEAFEAIKSDITPPDLILTHYRNDLHQDHRKVSELTWNTFRNHMILEYEIPKWDGDLSTPNTFIHLTDNIGKKKIAYLQQAYNSQQAKKWFTDDLFWSLMRIRGMECNSPENIAEAFYTRKLVLGLGS